MKTSARSTKRARETFMFLVVEWWFKTDNANSEEGVRRVMRAMAYSHMKNAKSLAARSKTDKNKLFYEYAAAAAQSLYRNLSKKRRAKSLPIIGNVKNFKKQALETIRGMLMMMD